MNTLLFFIEVRYKSLYNLEKLTKQYIQFRYHLKILTGLLARYFVYKQYYRRCILQKRQTIDNSFK